MPKKQKKTKEEKIAENFFPIDPSDSKQIIEKKYKKPDRRSLEKIEKTKVINVSRKEKIFEI